MKSNTKLLLVNVIHFKSSWLKPFTEETPATFNINGRFPREVPTLVGDMTIGHTVLQDGTQIAELQFADNVHSMVIVLPNEGQGKIKGYSLR